ncbi:MAG: histidine kinase [Novosphingobium sp.]
MADQPALPETVASPRVPARLAIGSAAAVWMCYFVLITVRGFVVGLEYQDELLWRRVLVTVAAFLVTLLTWPVLRLVEGQRLWLRIGTALLLMLPPALLIAAINDRVFSDVSAKMTATISDRQGVRILKDESGNMLIDVPDPPAPPVPPGGFGPSPPPGAATAQIKIEHRKETNLQQLTDLALSRYFLLLAWASLYLALGYAEHARAAERREGEYRRAAKAAELRSLRYQVNPHFLFNTLNSLSALVLTGRAAQAETMIQTISTFYRRSLAGDPTADVPLAEELRLQQLYLQIEAVRFPDRLRVAVEFPEDLADACVPGMLLQPLVENSVRYAIEPLARTVTITLAAREEDGRLVLTVADDGPGAGLGAGGRASGGHGIGLRNVADRLAARFGSEASVDSGPTDRGYATVIRLPLVRHGC